MPRQSRRESIDPCEVQVVHCIQRCVRKAFLCGTDPSTGASYEHRRAWIRCRMEFLTSVFAIECLTFAVMSNHLHVILRTRHDVAKFWSDEEVARRWLLLHPNYRQQERPSSCHPDRLAQWLVGDKELIKELRLRLSDISWWMRSLAEPIAVRANKEDDCTGRFWQGRYKSQLILDDASLLACACYVDLNPIRAAMAETLGTSKFTGANERVEDLAKVEPSDRNQTLEWERDRERKQSGWLSPVEIDRGTCSEKEGRSNPRRTSEKGFLAISVTRYIQLLDWTACQLRPNKQGATPGQIPPILSLLGIKPESWCEVVSKYGRVFKRVAGKVESVAKEAGRRKQKWLQAPGSVMIGAC